LAEDGFIERTSTTSSTIGRQTPAPSIERPFEGDAPPGRLARFFFRDTIRPSVQSLIWSPRIIEVLKKFLIPVFAFTVAAIGCSGSSNDAPHGDAGTAGAAAVVDGSMTGVNSAAAGPDAGCTLETFCPIFLQYCGATSPGYTTLAECMTTYAALGAANPYKQQCDSYHLCLAIYDTGSDRVLHCSHAAGGGNVCGF
jgi:hypothetical protein